MKENEILMCLIAFVLGYLFARMMRGNRFAIGMVECLASGQSCTEGNQCCTSLCNLPTGQSRGTCR